MHDSAHRVWKITVDEVFILKWKVKKSNEMKRRKKYLIHRKADNFVIH